MRIDPAIAKLVADPAPLFGAGEAVRGWSEDPAVAPLLAELGRYGSGTALSECPGLSGLIAAGAEGAGFARRAAGVAAQHLRAEPLALWPWRHFSNGVLHSVTIAADGDASLSLAVVDGAPWFAARDPLVPDLAAFQPGTLHAVVVGGTASGRIMRNRSDDPARAQIESQPIAFAPGSRVGEAEVIARVCCLLKRQQCPDITRGSVDARTRERRTRQARRNCQESNRTGDEAVAI